MIPAHTFLRLRGDQITPAAEEEFFTSLRMRNGTYKTTFRNRFAAIDHEIRKLADDGSLRVGDILDVGVSSGISTMELYDALATPERPLRIVATDLTIGARLVRVFPGCYTLTDETGFPLRHDLLRWTMKPWVVKADYRTGFFALRKAINVLFTKRARHLSRDRDSNRAASVDLVTPRLSTKEHVVVRRDDVTVYNPEFAGRFDFIRAANILNRGYFSDPLLRAVAQNLRRYFREECEGAMLVVRTHQDGVNHGTLFRVRAPDECNVIQRFGDGSEVEDLVLDVLRTSVRQRMPEPS